MAIKLVNPVIVSGSMMLAASAPHVAARNPELNMDTLSVTVHVVFGSATLNASGQQTAWQTQAGLPQGLLSISGQTNSWSFSGPAGTLQGTLSAADQATFTTTLSGTASVVSQIEAIEAAMLERGICPSGCTQIAMA